MAVTRHVFERLTTGLVMLDADLCVSWLNDAAADLFDVGVRNMRELAFAGVMPDGDAALRAAVERLHMGESVVEWRQLSLITLKQTACVVDVAMQAWDDGWLLEIHAAVPLASAATTLSASLRGVAHEIRNPLTGLRGAAQLLARRTHDENTRQLANLMMGEVDRLASLTNRLLSQDQAARPGMVNLYPLLEKVRQLCVNQVTSVTEDYDPSVPDIHGDADRLQQVLLNLTRNAIEAGATTLCLRTRIAHQVALGTGIVAAAVRVDVIDNGPGVAAAVREHVFEPMVSGRANGTGLGLALARETARDHGGDLRYSQSAEGTMFSLYLPLERDRKAHS